MQWSFNQPKGIKVTSFYALRTDLAKIIAKYEGPFPYISGRLLSITKNGINLVNDEGIRDTLLDLHNYSAMALMLLDE